MNGEMVLMVEHVCIYEERFANLEKDNAELKARMDGKKEDIHAINKEIYADRTRQIELVEKVTEVTVLLKAGQQQRKQNAKAFGELKDEVNSLQEELKETKEQLTDFVASQRSFRNTVIVGVPICISVIVGIIFHFI